MQRSQLSATGRRLFAAKLTHSGNVGKTIVKTKDNKVKNISIEGMKNSDWVLIDAGDVVLHLFQHETREFYNLEKMWIQKGEAETKTWTRQASLIQENLLLRLYGSTDHGLFDRQQEAIR